MGQSFSEQRSILLNFVYQRGYAKVHLRKLFIMGSVFPSFFFLLLAYICSKVNKYMHWPRCTIYAGLRYVYTTNYYQLSTAIQPAVRHMTAVEQGQLCEIEDIDSCYTHAIYILCSETWNYVIYRNSLRCWTRLQELLHKVRK